MNNHSDTLDEVIGHAIPSRLCDAATLLRFAEDVLTSDTDGRCVWVVLRAIGMAERDLRAAVDHDDDTAVVDARLAALRLRLGISGIRDRVIAGPLADAAVGGGVVGAAGAEVSRILREAAATCYALASHAEELAAA